MAKRAAQGAGTIRKKTVTRKGKEYTYWEARVTVGRDSGTGKQIQKSFSGKTQKEVREKMQAAAVAVNVGSYIPTAKMTVGQWLDIWVSEYLGNLKPTTVEAYVGNINNHIKPGIGAIRLSDLHPHMVQTFINSLENISPSTVRFVYKVLHSALHKAVMLEYIMRNPSANCVLPKTTPPPIVPLTDAQAAAVLSTAVGTPIEHVVSVALFTGLRQSELLGLTWDSIDMKNGIISVNKQLTRNGHRNTGIFSTPKSGKGRTITPAPSVIAALRAQKIKQTEMRIKAGAVWNNEYNLVFTMEDGKLFDQSRLIKAFRKVVKAAGLEGVRFHDLRHTYAVNAIRAGDDIKTIQGNLGHASAAFTLDRYGHFTERMKQDSAARMEGFIKDVLNL